MYVNISIKYIIRLKKRFFRFMFERYIKSKILKKEEAVYIISSKLESYDLEKYIDYLKKVPMYKNNIEENIFKYLEKEDRNSAITLATNSLSRDMLIKFVERFKQITIVSEIRNNINMLLINELEKEYGINIDVIFNKNINAECDALIYLQDINILPKIDYRKVYFLTEEKIDIYSPEYKFFCKYKDEFNYLNSFRDKQILSSMLYLHKLNKES